MLRYLSCFVVALWWSCGLYAQAPQAFKYQAVARDAAGNLLPNQSLGFRISILQNSPSGTAVYAEIHAVASNAFGLVHLDIGTGMPVTGNFSGINWGAATHFIKIEMDANGGGNYLFMGTSQLLSVPYALYAQTAANILNDQVNDADADPTNELQTISKSGNVVTLSNGGGSFTDEVNDADASPTNELQTISKSGNVVTLSNGGGSFTDETGPTYTAGTGINISGNVITNTAPNQVVTLTGGGSTTITGSYPNFTISSTGGGGGTLDQAYNFGGAGSGRTINVNSGNVQLNVSGVNSIGLRADLSNTGTGIISNSTTAGNTFSAIQASTNSASSQASAIIGNSTGTAWGVSGQVAQTASAQAAVYGSNLRTNGGHGVMGIGYNGTVGQTNYSQGFGVYGENFDAIAPLGNGVGTSGKGYYGVVGEDRYLGGAAGAYGVLSNGNFGATGTKTFLIDHPKDPENKILRHFSVESNEVLNIYRGNAAFDAQGQARIELPDYFEDINRNPTYQLTPIGGPASLYILQKIQNNVFVIGGGAPGMEVSWCVTAERNDAYMQQNPHQRQVEVEKREGQRGRYFMPYLYGQPQDKAIFQSQQPHRQTSLNILDK